MLSTLSRSVSLLTLSILLSPLSDFKANARWMEEDEANIECLSNKTLCRIHKDGTYTIESEVQLKALTEEGRKTLKTQDYTYDTTTSSFEILEAKTSNNGVEFIVPKEKIEDKPLASDSSALQEMHQILVPFERVSVGSIIYLKSRRHCLKPQIDNFFSHSVKFSEQYLWKNNETIIESELPLFSKVDDPRDSLNITETKNESLHTFQISLKKPVFEQFTGESCTYAEPSLFTSFAISTEKDYERTGKLLAKSVETVLAVSLPEELETIRSLASKMIDEVECINTITTHLIEKITYRGSWNTLEGHTIPRSLKDIITSGYGDCKEYAACLAAILNTLGYKAKIALVQRNQFYLEEANPLPNHIDFNHAIVKAIGPSEKTYWVDPTNDVTMADGIFPDIADRPVLTLDSESPIYERIPPISHQHAFQNIEETITIKDGGYVHREGFISLEGEAAISLTENLISRSLSLAKEEVLKGLCYSNTLPLNPILNFSESPSRTVKTVKGTFSYEDDDVMTRTNYGHAFPLRNNWSYPYMGVSEADEGALHVGHPQTTTKRQFFKNVSAKGLETLAFSVETPWLNAKRELFTTHEGVVVTETIEQLTSLIPAKDLKSEKYKKMQQTLRQYCRGISIIFSK